MSYWQKANAEIAIAVQARKDGNEGMARVCSRRAAGWAIKGYLSAKGMNIPTPNAMRLIKDKDVQKTLPQNLALHMQHLSEQVGVDFNLPNEIDLLEDAQELVINLFFISH